MPRALASRGAGRSSPRHARPTSAGPQGRPAILPEAAPRVKVCPTGAGDGYATALGGGDAGDAAGGRTSATPRSHPARRECPPTDPPAGATPGAIPIPRPRPARSRGRGPDRRAPPPPTPSRPSPRVPPGEAATRPALAGHHRPAQGRISAQRGVVLPSLDPVITSGLVNLTMPQRHCGCGWS
jgi:hypothetical protein